jgi:hypothetical protein
MVYLQSVPAGRTYYGNYRHFIADGGLPPLLTVQGFSVDGAMSSAAARSACTRTVHPFPQARFAATHRRYESSAVIPHAGICAEGPDLRKVRTGTCFDLG